MRAQEYLGVVLSDEYFWCHVNHGPALLVHSVDEGTLILGTESEISDLNGGEVVSIFEKNVLRFQIAMDEIALMNV